MRPLRDLPIRQKLVSIVMLASGGALLLASIGLVAAELVRSKRELAADLETLAAIVADNSTAALSFKIQSDAQETLSALQAYRSLVSAALYDQYGQPFAKYSRRNHQPPPRSPEEGTRFDDAGLTRVAPVLLEGKRIGTVYLRSDLSPVYGRLRTQAVTIAGVLLLSALAALALSSLLQ